MNLFFQEDDIYLTGGDISKLFFYLLFNFNTAVVLLFKEYKKFLISVLALLQDGKSRDLDENESLFFKRFLDPKLAKKLFLDRTVLHRTSLIFRDIYLTVHKIY